ncbi:MAG: hypothetical protein ABIE94_05830 [archaeon]
MNKNQEVITAASIVVVLCFVFIFLKTTDISGYAIYEQAPICEQNSECSPDQACCLFAGDRGGVCHDPGMCERIADMTAREYLDYQAASNLETYEEPEEEELDNNNLIAATVVLVIGLLIIVYFTALEQKTKQKSFLSRNQ